MSKKMKGVDFARAHDSLYEDAKTKLKYKTLWQDYQDLQKEVFDMKNRFEAANGTKKRLLAEVRFLGRRYTYLLQNKSIKQQQELSREVRNERKLSKGGKKSRKNEETRFKLPPLPDLKHKGRVYAGKEGSLRNTSVLGVNHNFASSRMSNKNYKRRISGGNETSAVQSNEPVMYLNQNENVNGGILKGLRGGIAVFDLNQDTCLLRNEAKLPTQAPTFDLNEISMDE